MPLPLASFTFADFNFGKSCHIWFLAIVLVLCVRLVRSCCCLNLLGFCFFACCFWFYCLPFLCAATASLMAFPLALVQIGFNRGLLCHRLPFLRLPLLHLHFLRLVYGFLVFAICVFDFACCLRMENCGWKCDVSGRTLTGLKCDIRTHVCMCVCVCRSENFKWSCYCKLKWFALWGGGNLKELSWQSLGKGWIKDEKETRKR